MGILVILGTVTTQEHVDGTIQTLSTLVILAVLANRLIIVLRELMILIIVSMITLRMTVVVTLVTGTKIIPILVEVTTPIIFQLANNAALVKMMIVKDGSLD